MQYRSTILLALAVLLVLGCKEPKKPQVETSDLPNIIYILADDLGYGDLSCLGQTKFSTPNIDLLAENGMLFTQHYSGSTVCAPSRSTLMTGLHTGHTAIRGNKEVKPEGQHPMPTSFVTVAEMLKEKGYATGAFGKWGLGYPGSEGDPNRQGFDTFYGYNCQRIGHNYYPFHLWDNDKKVILAENEGENEGTYAPNLIHQKTLEFIEKNKNKPFFAYVPSIIPHAELKVPESYMTDFRGKLVPEKNYKGCDPGCNRYKTGGYGSQSDSHAAFAGMITLLDEQVGEIVAKVKELGLEKNTIIMFSSDNGPHQEGGADPDYFDSNSIYRGYKRDLYEGGIRVPFVVQWPGKIKAGTKNDHISAFWDVLPTLADIAETKPATKIDGISFLPTLLGKEQPEHDYMYWEFHERGGRRAIRKDNWKVVLYDVKTKNPKPSELYNLSTDPSEQNDIASEHPEIVEELVALLSNRTASPVDVWNFN
ncbi:arylsulfatase [Reichenbachiella sp. MALMAid0571]|uniref:arylsulfatase n=1 Tax=Reichenbachiella sp. MALMAid0571 TaxID=3143939 RepID=UPI0032DF6771